MRFLIDLRAKVAKLVFFLCCFLGAILCFPNQLSAQYKFNPPSSWVVPVSSPESIGQNKDSNGYNFLLYDVQENISDKAVFFHIAIELTTTAGIQEYCPITIDYDPSYQHVNFHEVWLTRDGEKIDRLNPVYFTEITRENNLERHQYDGSKTIVLNLPDIRIGDIVEYSFTRNGTNPFFENEKFGEYSFNWSVPLEKAHLRISHNSDIALNWHIHPDIPKAIITEEKGKVIHTWNQSAVPAKLLESNVPGWYDPYQSISYSSFANWKDLTSLISPHYNSNSEILDIDEFITSSNQENRIIDMIRFVQNDVRYLGFENGINAFKPHRPKKVLNQRYGDCKDKSYLLSELFRNEGIESNPVLVSTYKGKSIGEDLVTPFAFNHCVVQFKYNDNWWYVDPTISQQGGGIENLYFPNYEKGLILKPNGSLVDIPHSEEGKVFIKETLYLDEDYNGADLSVHSIYSNAEGDWQRAQLKSNSLNTLSESYLDWYSNLYHKIHVVDSLVISDANNPEANEINIFESYRVDSIWIKEDEIFYLELYPLILESRIGYDYEANREMPFNVSPKNIHQRIEVKLAEDFEFSKEEYSLDGEGYHFSYFTSYNRSTGVFAIDYTYRLSSSYIDAKNYPTFVEDHKTILNTLAYYISYDNRIEEFEQSWTAIVCLFLLIILSVLLGRKIYTDYDPESKVGLNETINSFGGWLILPMIGLILSPIKIAYDFYSLFDIFNAHYWSANLDYSISLFMLVIGESVYNVFVISFTILLILLFFKRRTSLPRLIIIFYLSSLVFPMLDLLLVNMVFPDEPVQDEFEGIAKSFITACIWIPYFLVSNRVSNTFTKQYKEAEEPAIE